MSHDKKHNDSVKPLKSELKLYRRQGVELYLDGSPSKPKTIAREDGCYMRDYTEDENGRIARVDFDRIKNT